jgi:phosphoglycerate dehydrogenase-like enzyme
MALKVHLLQEHNCELMEHLRENLHKDISLTCSETLPDPPAYEILVCGVPDERSVEASPNLKYLIIPWAGLPRKTRTLMQRFPEIQVHNIHHNAVPAAEMAMALMLGAAKDLISIDGALRKGDWGIRYDVAPISLLAGKRALILGFGVIGKAIASRCLAFHIEVSAVSRTGSGEDGNVEVHPISRLPSLLPGADVLFLSLPLTDETKGMVGAEELSLLPDGAIVVNISRGRIVDEEALYQHLESGRIRAGLDVWYNYPDTKESRSSTSPSKYPFHELPNVVMTPHLAGHSDRTEVLRAKELARLLNLASEGEPLPNRVDLKRGY